MSACRSIAMAGRIAADFGARVDYAGEGMKSFHESSPQFLSIGKFAADDTGSDRFDALLCAGEAVPVRAPVSVKVSLAADAARPSTALTIMASTGLMDAIGDPAREPLRLPGAQLDLAAGLSAYTAMAALLLKPGGGAAQVSLSDVGVWLNWKNLVMAQLTGQAPSRMGRGAEWQTLRCRDGWIALVYRENDWPAVKRLLNDPQMEQPALDDRRERRRRATWIAERAEAALAGMTRAEVTDFARRNRIPIGPVMTPDELRTDPQFLARGFLAENESGPMPRLPLLWNGAASAPGGVTA